MSGAAGFPRPAGRGGRFWAITLAALLGVAATGALGRWQLQRAAQKEAIEAAMAQRAALPVLDGASLAADANANTNANTDADADADADAAQELLHRRVRLRGRWVPERTVYLDNRQMFGRPGFFVLTPLQVAPGLAVLVQRGWIPRNFEDRTRLEPVQTPAGEVDIAARIAAAPSRLYDFAAVDEGHSPIRQNLDLSAFRRETGLPLAPLTAVQTGAASEGLQREWPAVASGVERHYGYAFQWFGLCALIVFLYAWFQFFRRPRAA